MKQIRIILTIKGLGGFNGHRTKIQTSTDIQEEADG
jgi:hypothetical protein